MCSSRSTPTNLPLHRQEQIFRREGLHLPRSTLCGFVQGSVVLLAHVVEAMWEDAPENARWVCIDATGILVLAKEQCRLRHADIRTTTKTYGHLMLGDLRQALAALRALPDDDVHAPGSEFNGRGSVLGPLTLDVKKNPATLAKNAVVTGLCWRAIQDSNLWPSAPEADALSS